MRPVLILLCPVLLAVGAAPAPAAAQDADPSAAVAPAGQVAPAPGATMQGASDATYTGLPERTAQARTMRAYWHVFIAFAITWLLLFGYALSIGRRFARLDREVERLTRAAE